MVVGDVTISASPTSTYLGDVITFTGRVLLDGVPASGLWVSIYLDAAPAPPITLKGGETDVNGYYNIKWKSNYVGNLPIYALAAAYQGFTSPTIIVKIVEGVPSKPFTLIEDFIVPDSLSEGSDVNVRLLLKNAGTLGRLDWYINGNPYNPDKYVAVEAGRTPTTIPNGSTVWVDVYLRYNKMPAWAFTLIASNEDGSSYIRRTITLPVGIPTTLTINAPTQVAPGVAFTISGILKEKDTDTPIPNQPINLTYNTTSLGTATTGADGKYQKQATIPSEGVYTLKANFLGTAAYAASSRTTRMGVGVPLVGIPYIAIAPIVTGLAMVYLSQR